MSSAYFHKLERKKVVERLFWLSRGENSFFEAETTKTSILVVGTLNNNNISYAKDEITRVGVLNFPDKLVPFSFILWL